MTREIDILVVEPGKAPRPDRVADTLASPSVQKEQSDNAPPVVLEMPIPFPAMPKKKPATSTKKPSEDKEMKGAKKQAVSHSRKNGQKKTRKSREEMKIKRQRD